MRNQGNQSLEKSEVRKMTDKSEKSNIIEIRNE